MPGIMQGVNSGSSYTPDDSYWDNPTDASRTAASQDAAGEAFLGDLGGAGGMGGAAGMWGGLIGLVVGALIGIGDADMTQKAVYIQLEEEEERRKKLEQELDQAMDMRKHIERSLSAIMHPMEQKFRTRARQFGAQASAQGLTGAQGIAAQVLAENQYREQIGPYLPSIMKEAEGAARSEVLLKIQEIETREGIILEQQRLQLQTDMAAAQARGDLIGGIANTSIGFGKMIGQAIDDKMSSSGAGMTYDSVAGSINTDSNTLFGQGESIGGTPDVTSVDSSGVMNDVMNDITGG